MSYNTEAKVPTVNVFRVTFPDGTVYIAAKKASPEGAVKSLSWARKATNPDRPLVAAYLKSDGHSVIEKLHSDIDKDQASDLKEKYVLEAKYKKLNVIY